MLRAYLAAHVTVFLGMEDTGSEDLVTGPPAQRQGKNRLDRDLNVFRAAQQLAQARGLAVQLATPHGEGNFHEGGRMMRSPEILEAMGFSTKNEGMTIQLHGHFCLEGRRAF